MDQRRKQIKYENEADPVPLSLFSKLQRFPTPLLIFSLIDFLESRVCDWARTCQLNNKDRERKKNSKRIDVMLVVNGDMMRMMKMMLADTVYNNKKPQSSPNLPAIVA